jgi:hypothetical protein
MVVANPLQGQRKGKLMRRVITLALATAATLAIATPASASLVYDSQATLSAQGFGSAPRDLSIQGNGNATIEGGCVGVNNGGTINVGGTGSCAGADALHDGNTYITSLHDETPPPTDNQKFGIPTVADLGWTSAADIGILFNVTDPGSGESVTVNDLTLKFFSSAGVLLGSIDNPVGGTFFSSSDIGNGSAGFIFTVSADEHAYVNAILGAGVTIYTALEATVTGVHGGPETFAIVNLNRPTGVPEPATWAMMLLGFGGIGFAMRRGRKQNGRLLQVA